MKAITAQYGRPHLGGVDAPDCWCNPAVDEDDVRIIVGHHVIDVAGDEQPRMAVFSDQMFEDPPPRYGAFFS